MINAAFTVVTHAVVAVTLFSGTIAIDPQAGKVMSAGNGKITLTTEQGRQATYSVAADAVVMLNGTPSSLEKLTMGDEAKLTIDIKNSQQLVTAIDAQSASDKVSETSPGDYRLSR